MADTQVKDETFLPDHALDGDERVHIVDNPTGTPADRRVDARAMFNWFRRPSRGVTAYWVTGWGLAGAEKIGPNATTYGTSYGQTGYSSASERERRKRINWHTGTTAGSAAGIRGGSQVVQRGDGAGRGGFRAVLRFAFHTFPATYRAFVGLSATTGTIGNVDPSTLLNGIGFGKDAADTAWQIMTNDGTGVATKVALDTVQFPVNNNTSPLELELYCPPGNNQSVIYWVRRITGQDANGDDTFVEATGTLSADLPAIATALQWHMWMNNDVNAAMGIIEFMRAYTESYGD